MAKPTKTKSGKWQITVYLGKGPDGKRQYHKETFDTNKEAQQAISRIKLEQKSRRRSGLTVHHAMDQFINSVSAVLSPSTISGYRELQRNAYRSIRNTRLEDLTTQMVQVCINEYALTRTTKTVFNAHGFLNRVLSHFDVTHIGRITLPAKVKTDIVIPTDEELATCLALTDHPGMRTAILLEAGGGLRRSEIAALEPRHVDYENSTILVEQALVKDEKGELHLKSTKTAESKRTLDMMPEIMEACANLPQTGNQFLIGLTPDAITRRFERITKKAGLKIRFHDLRHYHASYMLAAGIPDKYAMQRMGHASNNMLHKVYQHIRADAQKEFADRLNQSMSEALKKAKEPVDSKEDKAP